MPASPDIGLNSIGCHGQSEKSPLEACTAAIEPSSVPDRSIPLSHGPADDQARIEIDNHGQVEPAFFCPEIGDVANPFLVGLRGADILLQQVWRHRQIMLGVGGRLELFSRFGPQILPLHAGGDGLAVVMVALFLKVKGQHWRAGALFTGGEGICNPLVKKFSPESMKSLPIASTTKGKTWHPRRLSSKEGHKRARPKNG